MNSAKKEHFRQLLLAEQAKYHRLLELTGGEKGLGQTLRDSVGELSAVDNHPADLGTETFERGKDLALLDGARLSLRRAEEALDRLEEGLYGWCEICGQPIPEGRLEAMPTATLCLDCRERSEQEVPAGRPLEEEVLGVPFSRGFLDGTDSVEFDAEDSWQAVARYGTSDGPQDEPPATSYDDAYTDSQEKIGAVEDVEELPDEWRAQP